MLSALDHTRNRSLCCREWKIANRGLSIFRLSITDALVRMVHRAAVHCSGHAPDGAQFFRIDLKIVHDLSGHVEFTPLIRIC
jgi:hypothetical protein